MEILGDDDDDGKMMAVVVVVVIVYPKLGKEWTKNDGKSGTNTVARK